MSHAHHHHHSRQGSGVSLLRMSAAGRLAGVAVILALLWAAVVGVLL